MSPPRLVLTTSTPSREPDGIPDDVLLRSRPHAEGEDRLMFGKNQRVSDRAGDPLRDQVLLTVEGRLMVGPAPVESLVRKGAGSG